METIKTTMKKMNLEQMEQVNGGISGGDVAFGILCGVGPRVMKVFGPIGMIAGVFTTVACHTTLAMMTVYWATN